jgi:SAM-dependent methyltransferase
METSGPVAEHLAAWAARVRANREQVERCREVPEGHDFYAPVARNFAADPRRRGEPSLEALRALVRPDDVLLDVGAGGGRYALPLALVVREVVALDPSAGMLEVLRRTAAEHGVGNVRVVQARWPVADPPTADVALIAHVGHDVEQIGPFLDALEAASRRLCVAVMFERPPPAALDALWPEVHGQPRASLPSLPELLALLEARRRRTELRLVEREPAAPSSFEELLNRARRLLWTRPDGAKDRRLAELLERRARRPDGRYALPSDPGRIGVVTWTPG